jgi:hypothetical protein
MKNKMTRGQFLSASIGASFLSTTKPKESAAGIQKDKFPTKQRSFQLTAQMKRDYERALSILKPTKVQLERGLELHRNSLIFDTYGFMPRAAVDGAAIAKVVRSKTDEIIKAIADGGGYIGICCIPRYLGGTGDIKALMKHIDYVAKKFGPDYVAIGTDVAYQSQYSGEENEKLKALAIRPAPATRTRFAALWPNEPHFETTAEMIQSIAWTNWPLFTVGMVQMGYSDNEIQKILGGNAMRVAKAALA